MTKRLPKEHKVAMDLAKLISAVDLDLDEIGYHLAKLKPAIHYNRLMLIAEAAVAEQESIANPNHDRYNSLEPLF